ncbi:MAG: DNA modification methylase [Lachnospiraceae bacterium]|nr:DNA modification methylase [Lachnospiraceae bacterium]
MNAIIETRVVPLSAMKPAKYNPRKNLKPGDPEYEKIKRSILELGYIDPIVWNETTGNIVGGHQRYKILLAEGVTEATVSVVHIDNPEEEKAANVRLNKAQGEFDFDALRDLFFDLSQAGFDLTKTGFDMAEADTIMGKGNTKDAKEDDFDVDGELDKPCFSRLGDKWHLGKHTVVCGDSTLEATYTELLGDTKVNLVCTDPPYMVAYENGSGSIMNDDLKDAEAVRFLLASFSNLHEAMAKDASIYVFYASNKSRIFYDAFEDAGFKVGAGLIWKKNSLVLTRTDWKYIHEPIIWGWRKDGKHIWYGDQKQTTVFEFDRLTNSKKEGEGHPTSKPVPLIAYLVKQCTQTNGIVLDGFLGSASTLIACEQINRVCYGVEIDPKYVDVAVNRYIKFVGNTDSVWLERDRERFSYEEAIEEMEAEN